jgi:hypothetical protein
MSHIQSILFDRDKFTLYRARSWLKRNGFRLRHRNKEVHVTDKYFRFRQKDPDPNKTYKTYHLPDGLTIITFH